MSGEIRGPRDALRSPRYAGVRTFARLPTLEEVGHADVAVLGAPYDGSLSFRPGARFGPAAIREASILLRPWHAQLGLDVFTTVQCADAGDAAPNPFDVRDAHAAIHRAAADLLAGGTRVLGLGGDHSCALPLLRAAAERHGPLSLVQLDAHSDTWESYFGETVTHGTFVKRAVEDGLVDPATSTQIGLRGPLYAAHDLDVPRELGLHVLTTDDVAGEGPAAAARAAVERAGAAVYVSFDVDVLDPAHAPGTGTPEPGGLTTREAQALVRALAPLAERIAGADVVEVSPPYDHAQLTASAGANFAWELMALLVRAAR